MMFSIGKRELNSRYKWDRVRWIGGGRIGGNVSRTYSRGSERPPMALDATDKRKMRTDKAVEGYGVVVPVMDAIFGSYSNVENGSESIESQL
ncbi:hypothetical protein Trydic_g20078 [Trypoxylus dichotomus]